MESPSVKSVGFASSTGGEAKPKARQKRSTIIQLAEFVKIKPKEKPQFSADQMTRGATFNVSDFDPDQAGEGALTDFERNIYNKLRPIARENGTPCIAATSLYLCPRPSALPFAPACRVSLTLAPPFALALNLTLNP